MMDRDSRLSILEKVAKGELSIEESAELLKRMEIEAEQPISSTPEENKADNIVEKPVSNPDSNRWKQWWLIPFGIFTFLTILAGSLTATSYFNNGIKFGFWISLVFFFICVFGMVVSFMAKNARWIHIRVTQKPGKRPGVINLSFPLPLRFARWAMNNFSWAMPEKLRDKSVGEAIKGFEDSISHDESFHVLVDEDDGDHVEIYIG
jgi:hypothetical protein